MLENLVVVSYKENRKCSFESRSSITEGSITKLSDSRNYLHKKFYIFQTYLRMIMLCQDGSMSIYIYIIYIYIYIYIYEYQMLKYSKM